jgi:uncharacterized protein YjiS (DUF1127 family)
MFKTVTFRSDGAFWPLTERADGGQSQAWGGLVAKLMGLVQHVRTERAARRAMLELAALDDRTLKDIGIAREEIWHAVRYGREALRSEGFEIARWS